MEKLMFNDLRKGCLYKDNLPLPCEDIWIFGYGSLMWDPGFPFVKSTPAKIFGYHRSLCIRSVRYRGTPERPGLVFGLDRGGSCRGIGFLVALSDQADVVDYLKNREMINNVYNASFKPIVLADGQIASALTFIVRRQHPSYVKSLTARQRALIVAKAAGQKGLNLDYVNYAMRKLDAMGVKDRTLLEICKIAANEN